jgi:DNA-binding NtrC family response regulator
VKEFDSSAVTALQAKTWPGNIRELRNVVERLIILGGEVITATDVEMFG